MIGREPSFNRIGGSSLSVMGVSMFYRFEGPSTAEGRSPLVLADVTVGNLMNVRDVQVLLLPPDCGSLRI